MPRKSASYRFPLGGTMEDWDTLTGDENDSIEAIGPSELWYRWADTFSRIVTPSTDLEERINLTQHMVEIDTSDMSCIMVLTGPLAFMDQLETWMSGYADLDAVAADVGKQRTASRPVDIEARFEKPNGGVDGKFGRLGDAGRHAREGTPRREGLGTQGERD